jgi:hypothetical protein
MAKRVYVCETCSALAEEPGHLCNPKGEPRKCNYCGLEHAPHEKHFCKGKLEDIKYACEGCGRLATSADFLCKPKKVPEA